MEKITVVTVVYNAENEIEDTIKSVLGQTYFNIEYIIIDGGSTDGTIDIIKKYEDKLSLWLSEPDKGIYDAMNKGIDKVTGAWISFMNAGDFFYSKDVIASVFTGDPLQYDGFATVYGDTEYMLQSERCIVKAMDSQSDRFMPFSHQAAFVRSELAKQYKFNDSYKITADLDFFLRLTKDGCVFKRVSVVVCTYDARKGLSMTNAVEIQRVKEFIDMQIRHYGVPEDSPYLKGLLKKAYIKQFIRSFIPDFIWMRMREKKIKNQLNK